MTGSAGRAAVVAAVTVGAALLATVSPAAPALGVPINGCPALFILGVQGTGQSSPTADPLADTGVVGSLIGPVVSAVPALVQRAYIGYDAGFGGIVPGGGSDPYVASVSGARANLDAAAQQVVEACPDTMLAGIGYSQGAQAMASFARDVGAGHGPVPADRVAGIALYANPDRGELEPVFPGRPGQTVPDPAPGTSGAAVSAVQVLAAPAGGAGIATTGEGYGALVGRVADICSDGDLACSAPGQASVLRLGAQLFAQADLTNPAAALSTLGDAFSAALGGAWNAVILHDFHLGEGTVDYAPQAGLGQRLVDAGDPRTPATDPEAAAARWNEIVATVAANPLVLLPRLLAQLSGAWGQLAAENTELIKPVTWLRFADTVGRHNSYALTGQLDSGIAWMTALAHDIAGSRS
ncbi:cutinase family protein [Nocardia puris]|uniref:cutinase family protein n=1 Tax=Nocardia puris TaxID=208602 RepID=UPI001895659E|nr:cutinase family protein [Nocardia puris]MBF6212152.1 cutinase family protein [Nocardia puris]